jgi:nucleotide-binding universal stress UspA family protein
VEPAPPATTTLSQLLQPAREEARGRANLSGSSVVAVPGARVATWTVLDPDGDAFTATFSLRRDGESEWREIAVGTREPFVRFQTRQLPEGTYETRLSVSETAPRPAVERLSHTFGTDELVVDHSPPEILAAEAARGVDSLVITVRGRDRLSLLEGLDLVFNHGLRESVRQPADGIRDGREETFILELPLERAAGASAVEISLLDAAGNAATGRLRF